MSRTQIHNVHGPMFDGEQRKRRGMSKVASKNKVFIERCRSFAIQHARNFGRVTASDVRAWAKVKHLEPTHQNAWGCVFKCHELHRIGYESSSTVSRRSGFTSVWTLA